MVDTQLFVDESAVNSGPDFLLDGYYTSVQGQAASGVYLVYQIGEFFISRALAQRCVEGDDFTGRIEQFGNFLMGRGDVDFRIFKVPFDEADDRQSRHFFDFPDIVGALGPDTDGTGLFGSQSHAAHDE